MRRPTWFGAILALFVAALSQAVPAASPESPLSQLLQQLDLGPGEGPRHWLERLGAFDSGLARERLLAVTRDGLVVRALDGDAAHVKMTVDFDDELRREGAGLVLVHNHPSSSSLSGDDLSHLGKAGVAAVVAIGHDGSVYAAARGPRFDALLCGGERYSAVREDVGKLLVREADAADVKRFLTESSTHLAALALARSRYLEYVARLAPDRQRSFERGRLVFGRVVASVSARLDARKESN
jgi:hypothetical protein